MASDIGKLKQIFDDIIAGLHSQKLMNRLGLAQQKMIRDRTLKGKDVEGKSWKKPNYNPQYAKRRARITGLPSSPVTLVFDDISGMMQSIDFKAFEDNAGVELFFTNDQKRRLAEFHNLLGAGKKRVIREFWGVSESEEDKLAELVNDELELLLQRLSEE